MMAGGGMNTYRRSHEQVMRPSHPCKLEFNAYDRETAESSTMSMTSSTMSGKREAYNQEWATTRRNCQSVAAE